MSKAKVIVLTVKHQNLTVAETAKKFGVSRAWVYKLLERYEDGGIEAVEARSRKPKRNSNQVPEALRAKIIEIRVSLTDAGLDAGPATISWHLTQAKLIPPALSTIRRIITNAGLVKPSPRKRPRSSYIRFEAAQPNETWQSDFTHWPLADGSDVEILNWLDDHSRFLLKCTAHPRVNGNHVVNTFMDCVNEYGSPQSTLTDNGAVYTARYKLGQNGFEIQLAQLGVKQKNGSPFHPETQGKIERFHQTLKRWLARQPAAKTLNELQRQLDRFQKIYNEDRPHKAVGNQTPRQAYEATIKATPPVTSFGSNYRVRYDKVDLTGKITIRHGGSLHHAGIGRANQRKAVLVLIDTEIVTVTEINTGEVLSEHRIDANRKYWPKIKGPTA